jgi:putative endonuclease
MSPPHLERGRRGEELAAAWYRDHGFELVARNWRCPSGEVDLIARRGRLLVVCEVKSRRNDAYGGPAAAVGRVKQQRLRRLAAEWLATTGVRGVDVRFDVTGIDIEVIEVIEAAF